MDYEIIEEIINYLKDENVELSDKFNFDKIDKQEAIYNDWISKLNFLLKILFPALCCHRQQAPSS